MDTQTEPLFFTSSTLRSWESSKGSVTATAISFCNNDPVDESNVKRLCVELFRSVWQGKLSESFVKEFLQDWFRGIPVEVQQMIGGVFVDLTWLMDTETDAQMPPQASSEARPRFISFVKMLVSKNYVQAVTCKERLEPELLEALGLVQQHKQFHKRVIRANTVLLYKQQKFNLLREESEGYSKLIVELSSNLPRTLSDIWDQEGIRDHKQLVHRRGELVHDRAEVLLKDIKSLIGYFDLDPNRVLDLILDVFTANLVDQWDLYLELLNLSPWRMRTKPAAGKQNGEMDEDDTPGRGAVGDGHPVFGQILGFKFSFYNSPDCTVSTPIQLYMVSAILIKNNLVKLEDLYPHLAPDDAGVENEFIEFKKSLAKMEREAGRSKDNALANAVLVDDGGTSSSISVTEKTSSANTTKKDPTISTTASQPPKSGSSQKKNQKAGLVNALIQIGAMVHAKKILDRLPQIVQMYSDIPRHMCRHIHEIIEPMYKMHRPADTKFTVKPAPRREDYAPPLNVIDHDWIQPYQKVYVGRKLHPTRYTFFYDRWKESLPTNITDMGLLLRYLKGLLLYVGQNLHLDISLLGKLIRLGRAHLKDIKDDDEGKAVRDSWISIIAKYFLPALSQVYANPGITQELWSLMKLLPYETRYGLYAEWEHRTYDQVPLCRIAKVKCIAEVQRIMRRLTKDNVKQYGRHIGKVVHSNPVIAFTKILDLLRNYDNQIPHVVDAARYLTDLEFDILSFCLIETLSNPYDSRLKDDGTSLAKWLMSLSLFTGTLCRKHPIELQGILQFMARQLLNDNVYDIVVLQDIISQMTGMRSIDDPTDAQLDSLAGGEHLKREALMLESTKLTRKPTQRLMKALQDSELVSVIGIMLGQQRKEVVFREHGKELKVSGSVLDHCHRMLVQYFEFLSTYMDKSLYAAAFPDISELCIDYGLEPEVAFHILRPKLQYLMKSDTGPEKLFTTAPGTPLPDTPGGEGINLKSSSDSMDVDTPTKPDNNPESLPTTSCLWERGLHDTILAVNNIVPPHVWKGVTPQFYTTFWQLSLFDIYVPETRYSAEIERQETLIKQLESDKSDNSNAAVQKRKKDKERFLQTVTMLQHERKVQIANYVVVKARLQREKDGWFATAQTRADCIINLMQYCLFPRCLFSPSDATYCAKLVYLLHELGTPNFSSLSLYDRILNRENVHSTLFSCSEYEAKNYGHFLAMNLQILTSWHKDSAKFIKEAHGKSLPGFQRRWQTSNPTDITSSDLIDYEEFRRAMQKWHGKLKKAFIQCLECGEYMQMRNAFLVLDKVRLYFPLIRSIGEQIEKAVLKIEETEKREDLKLLARSYRGKLNGMKWVELKDFCLQVRSQSVTDVKPAPSPKESDTARNKSSDTPMTDAPPAKEDVVDQGKKSSKDVGSSETKSAAPVSSRPPSSPKRRSERQSPNRSRDRVDSPSTGSPMLFTKSINNDHGSPSLSNKESDSSAVRDRPLPRRNEPLSSRLGGGDSTGGQTSSHSQDRRDDRRKHTGSPRDRSDSSRNNDHGATSKNEDVTVMSDRNRRDDRDDGRERVRSGNGNATSTPSANSIGRPDANSSTSSPHSRVDREKDGRDAGRERDREHEKDRERDRDRDRRRESTTTTSNSQSGSGSVSQSSNRPRDAGSSVSNSQSAPASNSQSLKRPREGLSSGTNSRPSTPALERLGVRRADDDRSSNAVAANESPRRDRDRNGDRNQSSVPNRDRRDERSQPSPSLPVTSQSSSKSNDGPRSSNLVSAESQSPAQILSDRIRDRREHPEARERGELKPENSDAKSNRGESGPDGRAERSSELAAGHSNSPSLTENSLAKDKERGRTRDRDREAEKDRRREKFARDSRDDRDVRSSGGTKSKDVLEVASEDRKERKRERNDRDGDARELKRRRGDEGANDSDQNRQNQSSVTGANQGRKRPPDEIDARPPPSVQPHQTTHNLPTQPATASTTHPLPQAPSRTVSTSSGNGGMTITASTDGVPSKRPRLSQDACSGGGQSAPPVSSNNSSTGGGSQWQSGGPQSHGQPQAGQSSNFHHGNGSSMIPLSSSHRDRDRDRKKRKR